MLLSRMHRSIDGREAPGRIFAMAAGQRSAGVQIRSADVASPETVDARHVEGRRSGERRGHSGINCDVATAHNVQHRSHRYIVETNT